MVDCIFIDGALKNNEPYRAKVELNKSIGATTIFEGTVREDVVNDKKVIAIVFTTQSEIAKVETLDLLNSISRKHQLINAYILHSTGKVLSGEICFRVIVESAHRKEAFEALTEIVDEFKARVPVFGKEILENNTHVWKQNK